MSRLYTFHYRSMIIDQHVKKLAHQLIRESGVFSADEEKWISIVLRLSRIASDFVSEETEEGKDLPLTRSASSTDPFSLFSHEESWNEPLSSLESKVNVLEIEGSIPEQSVFVDGYLMKKNLAHKVQLLSWIDDRE